MSDPSSRRAALLEAVKALPSTNDDSWSVPPQLLKGAGLTDDPAAAKSYVLKLALWAKEAIARLPEAPPSSFEATDFNDYYKIVMSRVQYLYAQARANAPADSAPPMLPLAQFQTQLRRRPTFKKGGADVCSCVFDLEGSFTPKDASTAPLGSFEASESAFRAALKAVGARKFSASTLKQLVADRAPKAAGIEDSLSPLNDAWSSALDGMPLFTLLEKGADFNNGEEVEVRLVTDDKGVMTILAQGPW